jgi:HPt (histidine-containing phosphotransfer) domain-containing protein
VALEPQTIESIARLQAIEAEGAPGLLAQLALDLDLGFREGLAAMWAAIRRRDAAALQFAAHTLRGSCGIVGAPAVVGLYQQVEGLARQGQLASVVPLLRRLEQQHPAVIALVRRAATTPAAELAGSEPH